MRTMNSNGVAIAYRDEGSGEPILLIHGFGSSAEVNWVGPGWVDALLADGRRVVSFDNRGHGASDKLYDPDDYAVDVMAEDARRLLDHLGIGSADVMGYSMGARIGAQLASTGLGRVRSLVLGGVGMNLVTGVICQAEIADALAAEDPRTITSDIGRVFRRFADRTGSDRRALVACMLSKRKPIPPESLARIAVPALVCCGTRDPLAGSARELVALLPQGELFEIPDRDHMTTVGDKRYMARVIDFLAARP